MSRRIDQVNEVLRKEIASAIARDVEFPPGILVTITRVETSPNLLAAKVFVSVLPFQHTEKAFRILKRHHRHIVGLLHKKLVFFRIPLIHFCIDTTEEKASEVEALLDSIPDLGQNEGSNV